MKFSFLSRVTLTIAVLMVMTDVSQAELMVGDKAPKLQTGKWIQGHSVSGFDSNHVYIVEFWATWCGPCVQSIPHLNELWQRFKDKGVIIIGQDVWDSDSAVAPFVKKMGTNMTYRVALDDKSSDSDGFMSSTWWKRAVNHHGIPTAFIINRDGVIAWIGHPMGLNEEVLDEIVSGRQDLVKATADYRKDFATDMQFQALQGTLNSSIKQKKWDDAQSALNKICLLIPRMTNSFSLQRLEILLGRKNLAEAIQFADAIGNSHSTNDYWQNELAWTIAASELPVQRCLALAETLAGRAVDLTKGTQSDSLDTLARVQFMLGKKPEAIATEEKAVSVEQNPGEKGNLEKTLASYRDGKLPNAEN
jgi:thiol-disulfide isomerase/thioredoxin